LIEAKAIISYKTANSLTDCDNMYIREFMLLQDTINEIEEAKAKALGN